MTNITASIVLYNNPIDQIRHCIESMQADARVHVLLVDNSEKKGGYAGLVAENVDILDAPGNVGFGRGHNLVLGRLAALRSEVHLVVNPDIAAKAGCVQALADVLSQRKDVALVGPRVVSPDGALYRSCKLLPTPWNLFARRFAPRQLYAAADARYELQAFDYDRELQLHNLSGAFLAFRAEAFTALEGFDPRYFMYLEDVDICRRASSLGAVIFLPGAEVVHEHGKGSYRSWRLLREHIRSAILYFNRFGWFVDAERRLLNRETLARVNDMRSVV
ncbi:glycosyltransferase family 2 protein [Ralstonia syzygii]|uniref:glycosyltransferase family 2 protein n=1 Tax=Ralstonia syzygii TaxID=28097 RepID=UPI0018D1CEEB|nr:glycosyltransferase family 2 protein [Ralstonia syzygii]CAH0444361.1 N-acetylglucosaminyl-diphospho-decaprenol L-rhamnosyltransferase [Ralstonia syzygii subsp. syzygii]